MVGIRERADPQGLRCGRSVEVVFEQREVTARMEFRLRREPGSGLATAGRPRVALHLHGNHRDPRRWAAGEGIGLIDAIDCLFLYG